MTSKFKKMSKTQLKQLEVSTSPKGFTIWANETHGKKRRHWIVDGSCFYEDGELKLGNIFPDDKLLAVFNPKINAVEFVTPKKTTN